MVASVTDSNRRVRTRTHGGVAGVRGRLRPLCRSNGQSFHNPRKVRVADQPPRLQDPALPRPYRTWGYPWSPLIVATVAFAISANLWLVRPIRSTIIRNLSILAAVLVS